MSGAIDAASSHTSGAFGRAHRRHPECAEMVTLGRGGRAIMAARMSPTVLRARGFRLYFFSDEEARPHVHVDHATGEAKFWLTPGVQLARNRGLRPHRLAEARRLIEEHRDAILTKWQEHEPH
jgi:hypothetical protein